MDPTLPEGSAGMSRDRLTLHLRGSKGGPATLADFYLCLEISISLGIKELKYVQSQRRIVSLKFARFKHLEKNKLISDRNSMNTYKDSVVQKETP